MKLSSVHNVVCLFAAALLAAVPAHAAFGVPPSREAPTTRRDVLAGTAAALLVAAAPVTAANAAITACPPKSSNCIRTTWTAPEGTKNIGESLQAILDAYPQQGQNKVDLGGWSVAEGDLLKQGRARVEFRSGLGNFAKFLNGGKPFVDDLEIEVVDGNKIEIKSSSRVGESDLDVNRKRLQFLAAQANSLGWEAPEPKY